MAASLSMTASKLLLSSFPPPSKRSPYHSYFGAPVLAKPFLRGTLCISQAGPESAESLGELFSRAESLIYTLADAAVSSSDAVTSTTSGTKQNSDWLSGIANYMEFVLKILKDGLSTLHVPYAYGFAIILLTVLVKAATFPLTKKQIESGMAMRSLQPQIKAVQERYAGDQERIQVETARLYKLAGINPLAGCLPTLATIPVWIGLYRALSNVADEGLLTEGFFWIPSLAGPTTIAARQSGSSTSWLFPFVDGNPPLGWSDTLAYLVLPVLLVVSQYVSVQIMQSSQSNNDPSAKNTQLITQFLPLMIGYFALSVPSGLSLYWFTNNILSTAQQVYLQKLGGAKNPLKESGDANIKQVVESRDEKVVLSIDSAIKEKPKEKLTPEGPRPGERFRLLKEQEERRKLEKEQQKKASEGAVLSSSGQNDAEANLVSKSVNGATSKHQNEAIPEDVPNGVAVNGGPSTPEISDAQTVPSDQLEGGEASSSIPLAEGTNDQQKN